MEERFMKKYFAIIALVLSVFALASCSQGEDSTEYECWETIKSFPDWTIKPYHTEIKTRTLHVDLNKDAQNESIGEVVLALYQVKDDGRAVPAKTSDVQLYKNGVPSPDNKLHIGKDDKDIEVGLEVQKDFLKENGSTTFNWKFKVEDNGGLDYINEYEVSGSEELPLLMDNTSINMKHNRGVNKLEVTFWTVLAILACLFVAFVFFMRLQNPAFRVRRLTYGSEDFQKTLVLTGVSKVVFSTKKGKQSLFNQLLTRKTLFVVNDFFTAGDVIVTPKDRIVTENGRRNGGRIQAKNYTVSNNTVAKDDSAEITNDDIKQTITITIK